MLLFSKCHKSMTHNISIFMQIYSQMSRDRNVWRSVILSELRLILDEFVMLFSRIEWIENKNIYLFTTILPKTKQSNIQTFFVTMKVGHKIESLLSLLYFFNKSIGTFIHIYKQEKNRCGFLSLNTNKKLKGCITCD